MLLIPNNTGYPCYHSLIVEKYGALSVPQLTSGAVNCIVPIKAVKMKAVGGQNEGGRRSK